MRNAPKQEGPRKPSVDIYLFQMRSGLWKARMNFKTGLFCYTMEYITIHETLAEAELYVYGYHKEEEENASK